MKSVWKFLWVYLAFLLQSLFFENIKIFSCSPDILLTAVIICAVSMDFVPAAALGAFAGVMIDAMYSEVFGINVLVYMYLGLLVSLSADKRNCNSPLIMGWICFISVAALEIVTGVLKMLMLGTGGMGNLIRHIFVKGIFAGVVALLGVLLTELISKRRKSVKVKTEEEVSV